MSVSERYLKNQLDQAKYYYENRNTDVTFKDKSIEIIKKLYEPFSINLVQALSTTSTDGIVELAETAFICGLPDIAKNLIDIYFEMDSSKGVNKNNYYIRALLVRAQVNAEKVKNENLKAEKAAETLVESIKNVQKGVELIAKPENKEKYSTTLYNASIITCNILKDYLKLNWAGYFWEIFEKISALLEESDDMDFNWRIYILVKLAECYMEADKKAEGSKALDKIGEILKKKGDCDFMDEVFRIRIHLNRDNNGALGNIKKDGETNPNYPQFKYLYTVQAIKSNIITDKDIDKEVNGVITALCPDFFKNIDSKTNKYQSGASIKLESWKSDVLAELAFSIMKFPSMLTTAFNLYYFLFQSGSNSLKGKIFLENIRSQKIIYDLEEDLKENVQPVDIIRQKRIDILKDSLQILDRNMSGCARLQDYDLINETSMLIFNTAMPFFKKSLRKYLYKAFYTSTEQLEQISSNENMLRAAMHYELAKYYLDEDLLQEANSNLIKALNNDYSIPKNKLTFGDASANQGNAKGGKAPAKGANAVKSDDPNLIDSITNNVSYHQRFLEQYLVYLKRYVGVKVSVYKDPDNTIDKLIFESDNIKNSKNPDTQKESIDKCMELIRNFKFDEFELPKSDHDFVEEEINEFKVKHDLKLYDDKKHFINICSEIAGYCYKCDQYESVMEIDKILSPYIEGLSTTKDIEQIIGISQVKLNCAMCYKEYLLEEGLELYGNNYDNFDTPGKKYTDIETNKFDEWRKNLIENLQEATKLAVSVNQPWLIFNAGIEFWNGLLVLINAPTFTSLTTENVLPLFADLFEAMNNSMIFYEQINAEKNDTDYYKKVDLFCNLTEAYCKLLNDKGKQEECIRICDIMLTRKIDSKYRKKFDTIKAKASNIPSDPAAGGKKKAAPAKAPAQNKGGKAEPGAFSPSQDMTLISDCFTNLENAIINPDEKGKFDALKKGIELLDTYKINFNDESTLELDSELWYKYGIQMFELKNYKYSCYCSDKCVSTYDNIDINNIRKRDISLTLKKWYCLGFLLYGDSLLNLVDKEKQERLPQIKLYMEAIEKIITSAKIAESAKQYYVILQDLKAFFSISINLIDQPQNREKLCQKFQTLHQILMSNRAGGATLYSDPEFLLLFFSIFCLCINETKNWELGEKVIGDALRIIPNNFHHVLLEHKLFYYSKQGKSFLQNLEGGGTGNKDVLTKAKLFTKLARSSKNKADQFKAYNSAIELLKTDQNIFVCNVIFELASWLYKNNYPYQDIEDNLNQAADIVLEIEPLFDDEDDLEDDGKTLHSKRSSSSRTSRLSKRSKSKRSATSKQSKHKSTASKAKSKASERAKSRNYSKKGSNTKTVFAKLLDYDPYPVYLNIQHMEHLFKIEVFLSMVTQDYKKKQEYLLDAFYVLKKILELSIKTMNVIEFFEKNKENIEQMNFVGEDINPLSSLVTHYYIEKDINIPAVYTLPENLDGWLTYEWPENFIKRIILENEINATPSSEIKNSNISLPNYTIFCQKSFETPYQFYYYFSYMFDKFMNEYYYHSESLLMAKFGILYAKYILNDPYMVFAYELKFYRLVFNICVNDQNNKVSKELFEKMVELIEDKQKLTIDIVQKKRDDLRQYSIDLNTKTEDSFMPTGIENIDAVIKYADDLKSHISWIELGREYYNTGFFNFSKEFCTEAIFHSLVLKEKDCFIDANIILANINFIESDFESCTKLFLKVQNINQEPDILFRVVRKMCQIFDYMGKYEEMINYLLNVIDYCDNIYENKIKTNKYTSSQSIFYQIYTYALINMVRALVKKYSENIRANEYNIIKEQKSNINAVLKYFDTDISPRLKKFNNILAQSSMNIFIIFSLYDYIDITLECITKNNLFVYVSKEELKIICDIFENCLKLLEDISSYLNNLQTFIPLRIDNSLIYMPVHRILAYSKIIYAKINNLIGEFKARIKRESHQSQKLSLNDKDIDKKFGEGVKYNQEVIDYLNGLTKQIHKMNAIDARDNLENMNRYEKSISLLGSCESLIPKISSEYLLYFIEKINSFRLQSMHNKELKILWKTETLEKVNKLQNPPEEEENEDETSENKKDPEKDKIVIQKFHQNTINLISDFEKLILGNENKEYDDILKNHPKELMKYYFCVLETSGYLNIELAFKALVDYQNSAVKKYFNEDVIKRYVNPKSRDWSTFALYNKSLSSFSFDCDFGDIYRTASLPESIFNYRNYINEIPYYKNANENFYNSWNTDVKDFLPNNSAYFIFQMTEDKTLLYIGLMTIKDDRQVSYYIKRIVLNREINQKIDDMIQTIKTLKHILIKTVIVTDEEMEKLFLEQNDKINKILFDLENNLTEEIKNAFKDINDIINPVILETEEEAKPNPKDKKAAAKKPADKGKKDAKKTESSDVPLPTSGLEQITFLIDHRLYDLPIESLSFFGKIPYKSNDFSLNVNIMRLKTAGFTSGSSSISLPGTVRYYLDYSNEMKLKYDIKNLINENMASGGGGGGKKDKDAPVVSALEGVISYDHKPSIPELQKLYMNSNTFIFTSQTALLYQFPFEIFDTSRYSKCRIGLIFDRISNTKNFVDQNSLIPKTFNFNYQPLDTIAMMTICGVASILTTKWSVNYNEVSEMMNDIIEGSIQKGDYMSFSINKYKEPKRIPIEKKEEENVEEDDKNKKDNKKPNPKDKGKVAKETVVLDETNSIEVKKNNIFKTAPVIYGLNNVKLV